MQQVAASDGGVIAYRDEGSRAPEARAIVLLHGLMAHGGFFSAQAPLGRDFRLVSVDLRGHGGSRGGEAPSVDRAAADVAELAATLDLRGVIVIGWSLGATVMWRLLAGAERGRFAGAVVIDMTPRVCNDSDWQLGLTPEACAARTAMMRSDFDTFARGAAQNIFAPSRLAARQKEAAWAADAFAANDPDAIVAMWASLQREDMRPLLRKLTLPTLVVHGAESKLYGCDTADHLQAALPNARAILFERSGHAPHLEEPERFNALVAEFAAKLPPVPAHASAKQEEQPCA